MRHADAVRREEHDVLVRQVNRVRSQDPAVQHAELLQQRGHGAVRFTLGQILRGRLGDVDLHQRAPRRRRFRRRAQAFFRKHVRGMRAVADLDAVARAEAQAVGVDPAFDAGEACLPIPAGQFHHRRRDQHAAARGQDGRGMLRTPPINR